MTPHDELEGVTWMERAARDPSLQAFLQGELVRAGIRVDTLEYQNHALRHDVATLTQQLEATQKELRRLRRSRRALLEKTGVA
jgi:hypothetical protein